MSWTVDVDGNDITQIMSGVTWNPKLSRPSRCTVRWPGGLFQATTGVSELHLSWNGSLLFSGPVWFQEQTGEADATFTEITAYDHLIYLSKRMCKTPESWPAYNFPAVNPPTEPGPCNLADPSKVITDFDTAPQILAAFIQATIDCDPGSFPITVGSVAAGGASVTGVPADWPKDIQTIANMLLDTGQLDILVVPGYGSSAVNLTNGDGGNDLTGSVNLQYGTGAFNAMAANQTSDMEKVVNALWYLLAPHVYWYTGDLSHYRGSITPTAPNVGGSWPPSLIAKWTGSRATYGYMQEIDMHDTNWDAQVPDGSFLPQSMRALYEEMFANEAFIRATPMVFATSTPDRTSANPAFAVGDTVTMQADTALGGGYSGSFRVYEFTFDIDTDGVGTYSGILGSANQG